ncbi:MAG: Na+:solute symporter [Phycisphaerales bacterium]|jgi:Na+/proline symporter
MQLHAIDISIIALYLVSTVVVGFLISKRASKNMDSYFLGGKSIPWYILGVSNASGMFDITGTMWLVYLLFVYGLKGAFIPWLWPVFNQIFLMVYLSCWLRRSNVMTGAEWMKTRFGTGTGAQLSHIIIVIFAIVSVIGFLAYGFKGIGKFSSEFLPWDLTPNQYGLIFMGITTLYVVKGGMHSVVLTELIQFGIMTVASIAVGIIAMNKVAGGQVLELVPEGWQQLHFGWRLDLDWSGILDSVNTKIAGDGYELFTCFMMMIVFKGFLLSIAGPAPNYDMQRILATKSPKEAAKMSGFVSVALFFPRYMLIGGLAVLAIVYLMPDLAAMGEDIDFEMVLPMAMREFVPTGLLGILMAGLIAAFMSTFAATVNAAPAYIVNDIYKRYINPDASDKQYVKMSYIISLAVVVVGISFGLFVVESIDSVTQWIVSSLWGGYAAANVLKWHWWRFNGHGYFWGMVLGLIASLILPLFLALPDFYIFPFILVVSLAGCIAGTLLTKPEDDEVLKSFYKQVRPWGFWKPIHDKVVMEDPGFQGNKDFKRDMFNVVIGIIWQTSLVVIPIYLIIRENVSLITAVIILAITSFILKKNWYDKLTD